MVVRDRRGPDDKVARRRHRPQADARGGKKGRHIPAERIVLAGDRPAGADQVDRKRRNAHATDPQAVDAPDFAAKKRGKGQGPHAAAS